MPPRKSSRASRKGAGQMSHRTINRYPPAPTVEEEVDDTNFLMEEVIGFRPHHDREDEYLVQLGHGNDIIQEWIVESKVPEALIQEYYEKEGFPEDAYSSAQRSSTININTRRRNDTRKRKGYVVEKDDLDLPQPPDNPFKKQRRAVTLLDDDDDILSRPGPNCRSTTQWHQHPEVHMPGSSSTPVRNGPPLSSTPIREDRRATIPPSDDTLATDVDENEIFIPASDTDTAGADELVIAPTDDKAVLPEDIFARGSCNDDPKETDIEDLLARVEVEPDHGIIIREGTDPMVFRDLHVRGNIVLAKRGTCGTSGVRIDNEHGNFEARTQTGGHDVGAGTQSERHVAEPGTRSKTRRSNRPVPIRAVTRRHWICDWDLIDYLPKSIRPVWRFGDRLYKIMRFVWVNGTTLLAIYVGLDQLGKQLGMVTFPLALNLSRDGPWLIGQLFM